LPRASAFPRPRRAPHPSGNELLRRFSGDDAFPRSDEQHLVAGVDVHLVACAGAEIDDVNTEVIPHLRRYQRLPCDATTGKERAVSGFLGDLIGFME
jgi:hypothetical protein